MTSILGISAFYHDSAAAIIVDGKILAAAQEERFTRKKHDSSYPYNSIKYVLDEAKLDLNEIDQVVFYERKRADAFPQLDRVRSDPYDCLDSSLELLQASPFRKN